VTYKKALWLLLLIAFVLRILLILSGGQLYMPDEIRYGRALQAVHDRNFLALLQGYDHTGFTILAIIPASFHKIAVLIFAEPPGSLLKVPALLLSLASVGCIGMTYAVARRARASSRESFIAALLMALSAGMFYWSRHLIPYDTSILIALIAIYVGIQPRGGVGRSFVVGFLACWVFLCYNGYWLLALIVMAIHLVYAQRRLMSAVLAGLGFIAPVALFTLLTLDSYPFVLGLVGFAGTVTQGWYGEGWSLPFEYFWVTEGLIALVWLGGCVLALSAYRHTHDRRVLVWLGAIAAIYLGLVVTSVLLQKFVVYGRTARELIPFICLLAAYGYNTLPRRTTNIVLAVTVLIAIPNFLGAFLFQFPEVAEERARLSVGTFARDYTFQGSERPPIGEGRYVLLNTQYIYPVTGVKPLPHGAVLFTMPHPYNFAPFLYEGLDPAMRDIVREAGAEMILVDTGEQD
jgi:hypothetical protein